MTTPAFISPLKLSKWQTARKTKGLRAKHSTAVISDLSLLDKLLVQTIEGEIQMRVAMICIGAAGEAWQQSSVKLLEKYTIEEVTIDGWLICVPKPGAAPISCVQIIRSDFVGDQFYIVGLWGKTLADGTSNAQVGKVGDYVCRSATDQNDVWIVEQSIFENTYEVK